MRLVRTRAATAVLGVLGLVAPGVVTLDHPPSNPMGCGSGIEKKNIVVGVCPYIVKDPEERILVVRCKGEDADRHAPINKLSRAKFTPIRVPGGMFGVPIWIARIDCGDRKVRYHHIHYPPGFA